MKRTKEQTKQRSEIRKAHGVEVTTIFGGGSYDVKISKREAYQLIDEARDYMTVHTFIYKNGYRSASLVNRPHYGYGAVEQTIMDS